MPNLIESRAAFIGKIGSYLANATEQARFTEVLDHFIAWSATKSSAISHNAEEYDQSVVSFKRDNDGVVLWSAFPRRGDGAKLEILPRSSKRLGPALLAEAQSLLRSISTKAEVDNVLKVSFAALKNANSRTRVSKLLDKLLV